MLPSRSLPLLAGAILAGLPWSGALPALTNTASTLATRDVNVALTARDDANATISGAGPARAKIIGPPPPTKCHFIEHGLMSSHVLMNFDTDNWNNYDNNEDSIHNFHQQAKGCGAMTGWKSYRGPTGKIYAVSFNLPETFKSGCPARALVTAGGPHISCSKSYDPLGIVMAVFTGITTALGSVAGAAVGAVSGAAGAAIGAGEAAAVGAGEGAVGASAGAIGASTGAVGASEGAAVGASEGAAVGASEGAAAGASEGAAAGANEGAAVGASEGANGASEGATDAAAGATGGASSVAANDGSDTSTVISTLDLGEAMSIPVAAGAIPDTFGSTAVLTGAGDVFVGSAAENGAFTGLNEAELSGVETAETAANNAKLATTEAAENAAGAAGNAAQEGNAAANAGNAAGEAGAATAGETVSTGAANGVQGATKASIRFLESLPKDKIDTWARTASWVNSLDKHMGTFLGATHW